MVYFCIWTIIRPFRRYTPIIFHFLAIFGYFGYYWQFLCWLWSKKGIYTFCWSCQVSRYAAYPYLYGKSNGILKIDHFIGYFWLFCAGHDQKTVFLHSVHHTKWADNETYPFLYIKSKCTLKIAHFMAILGYLRLFSAIFGYFYDG